MGKKKRLKDEEYKIHYQLPSTAKILCGRIAVNKTQDRNAVTCIDCQENLKYVEEKCG